MPASHVPPSGYGHSPEHAADMPGWGAIISSLMPDLHCRRCDSTRWELAAPDDADVVCGITYHRLPKMTAEGFVDCVPLICAQCGGVEVFSKDHLLRWWRSRRS